MSEKRTVTELSRLGGRVYVYLKDDCTGESFLKATEAEGFTFGDGVKPTDRHYSRVMALTARSIMWALWEWWHSAQMQMGWSGSIFPNILKEARTFS